MENAQTPDEGKKSVNKPVAKPAAPGRKPASARPSRAKSAATTSTSKATPASGSKSKAKPAAKPNAKPARKPAPAAGGGASVRATPATARAAGESSTVKSPAARKPAARKPAAPKPAARKSATQKPVPRKPAAATVDSVPADSAIAEAAIQAPATDDAITTETGITPATDATEVADFAEDTDVADPTVVQSESVELVVATDESIASDSEVVEKPDAVLAGLARLRALASQFAPPVETKTETEPTVEPAVEPAADLDDDLEGSSEAALAETVDAPNSESSAPSDDAEDSAASTTIAEPVDDDETEDSAAAAEAQVERNDAAPESDLEPEPEPEAEPETEAEPEAEPEPEPKFEAGPETTPEPEQEPEPELAAASDNTALTEVTLGHGLEPASEDVVLEVRGLSKDFGETVAVDDITLTVRAGVFYGIVGPNGAGKTTTLSMITGLLRPDSGTASVNGVDVWTSPETAKRSIGVLPDRLRIFDRLTGSQLLYYSGVLRGLNATEVRKRSADLATAFGLDDVMGRLVSDYSSGMLKKVALAAAMIHSPRLLVLDEPFESVDPVSAATVTRILKQYVDAGGTVLLSSHRMELVQRVCSHVAVIVEGKLLADGTIDEVRDGKSLEDRFVQLTGKNSTGGGLEWLSSFSD